MSKSNVYILLDRSGSMQTMWSESIGSINGYVKALPKGVKVFLATFDTISFDVIRNTYSDKWRDVHQDEVTPRGMTPLYDSAARVMWRIEEDKPERAIFVTMTDGFENNSKYFRQNDVVSMTNNLKNKGYEVIFLGANFEQVGDVAKNFGLNADKWANVTRGSMNQYMSQDFAIASTNYISTGLSINTNNVDPSTSIGTSNSLTEKYKVTL
jgi:hypothetical protein